MDRKDPATTEPSGAVVGHRLQILATEHWSLLASRSLAWSETFSRATMFLATLSGAVVALALAAQAFQFGDGFRIFALVILPVVLFVGVTTVLRLASSNYHDAVCVMGMNRIRHAYLEIDPELAPYFVMSPHDDVPGITATMGLPPGQPAYIQFLAATPILVTVVNSIIAGVIAVLVVSIFDSGTTLTVSAAIAGVALTFFAHQWAAVRSITRARSGIEPLFPSPTTSEQTGGRT